MPTLRQKLFLRHLKHPDVENYLPYMYRDSDGNVTVGIGHLLPTASDAKNLDFFTRGPNVAAEDLDIERAFNRVKNAPLPQNTVPTAFERFSNIRISEAYAETLALDIMDDFQRIVRSRDYYPEFDSYPVLAKMGLLDLVYNRGAKGARDDYKRTTAAVRRRNWKQAGIEQRDGRRVARANIVQAWFNRAAQQEPFFISHTNCRKPLASLAK